jgi:serine/threonine-protein kinase RsbW
VTRLDSTKFIKEWLLQCQIGSEKAVLSDIANILQAHDPLHSRKDDILTAVSEACLNAFEHGNGFDSPYLVKLRMEACPARYLFQIYDMGEGLTKQGLGLSGFRPMDRWAEDNPRGWGLHLIQQLSDRVESKWCRKENRHYIEIEFVRREARTDG